MRNKITLALIFLAIAPSGSPALAQDEDPSVYAEPVTPDPAPNNGVNFAPQAATAGTAIAGIALASAPRDTDCKPLSPCALPTPALQAASPPLQARASHGGKSSASS